MSSVATLLKQKIKLSLAIETRIYREGLMKLLSGDDSIEIVFSASNKQELFEKCRRQHVNVILLDSMIPDYRAIISEFKQAFPDVKFVLLSVYGDMEEVKSLVKEGVAAFITREDSLTDLRGCFNAALINGFWCSNKVANIFFDDALSSKAKKCRPIIRERLLNLTKQQANVLELVEKGMSNKEIARRLSIETATVKNHVHEVLRKLNVKSRNEAAAKYRDTGQPVSA